MAGLTLQNVRKVYPNGYVGVADATFKVTDGELLVLVGPSGCGKSTLLRMIAGLEEISSGALRIGERVVNAVAPKDRDIAMVFQSYALYPHMTVADNLAFGLKLRGIDKQHIDTQIREAARILELETLLDRKPAQLSGGQRQRVALGRALVRKPQVFLLDEPLSNLDAKLRSGMRAEIARIHRDLGTTMIYVTHDQIEAMTLGQRIVVMKAGEIQQIDTPMALYNKPVNLFVAEFLGSPKMNLLHGKWRAGQGLELSNGIICPIDSHIAQDQQNVIAGCRPEHAALADAAHPSGLAVTVEAVEPIGNEAFVHLKLDGAEDLWIIRVSPQGIPVVGETRKLLLDVDQLHFFDAQTEANLAFAPSV